MKQQILVIHGGDAFEKYDDYFNELRVKNLTLERIRSIGWKGNLGKDLGINYDVLTPKMPNAQNARYKEWEIWFEKIIPLLDNNLILVGHSLGGIFLVKYLTQNKISKKIKATFLIAAPYNTPVRHPLVDFNIITPLDNFAIQAGKIIIYHSKDDVVVPFSNSKRYHKELPDSKFIVFEGRGHFTDESFPEIVKDIQSL